MNALTPTATAPLVDLRGLHIHFASHRGDLAVVNGVDLAIPPGRTVCLVGESGCGKSVTAKAILRLVEAPGRIARGEIMVARADGSVTDLVPLDPSDRRLRAIRGGEIAMIHQEPMSFLSPLYTIGNQIVEAVRLHRRVGAAEARRIAVEVLGEVGMPAPAERFDSYTFQLSGGQRQRAMIAMALVCRPRLLIADEPTTALDVTTQANILDLLNRLKADSGMSILFITHDLGVVEEIADDVAVMYLGRIVEQGPASVVLTRPQHPYTRGLLASMPRLDADYRAPLRPIPGSVPSPANRPTGCSFHPRCGVALAGICDRIEPPTRRAGDGRHIACHLSDPVDSMAPACLPVRTIGEDAAPDRAGPARDPLVEVHGLTTHFPIRAGFFARTVDHVRAVTDVSFTIQQGETLGLVGESGCGKSTLGQTLVGLLKAQSGRAIFRAEGRGAIDMLGATGADRRCLRTDIRMIFQDPTGSLNPRLRVRDIIGEVLEVNTDLSRTAIDARVETLLDQVGLSGSYAGRYPHAFSGGQRQRIAIARALAGDPKLVIADEAVSALDVSVQTQVINLMRDLQARLGLTYLFVSHDLGVIANISDRVAVMYAGRIVEIGPTDRIFRAPRHPYTEALLAAIPGRRAGEGPRGPRIDGHAPARGSVMTGCAFADRCRYADARCRTDSPLLRPIGSGHDVACLRAEALDLIAPITR